MSERIIIINIPRPTPTCVCHAANCLARYAYRQILGREREREGVGWMSVRLEDKPTMISALALLIQPTERPWGRAKKSRDGVRTLRGRKLAGARLPFVCQLVSQARWLIWAREGPYR